MLNEKLRLGPIAAVSNIDSAFVEEVFQFEGN